MIWSLPRCGSTSLMNLVNAAGGNCCNEPFSNKNFQAPYREQAMNNQIDSAMDDIFSKWSGMKHCGHPSGWPFPDTMHHLNEWILTWPNVKVILLYRRNMLKQIVSTLMALQCDVWHTKNGDDLEKRLAFPYQALDLGHIEFCLKRNTEWNNKCRELIKSSGKFFVEIPMEGLFESPNNSRVGITISLLNFLGLDWPDRDAILKLTTQDDHCLSKLVYPKVPNIEEVEKRFGGLEHGSLFV